ncbi:DUF421 domain-containing protein [Virgibacillus halodenitrificans]|jgi:uncharacterized membrane protein YcaP (DUF421 family)|uniref:DUF421 domain-containing protein n=1 Tax=Virgibacillus halodenitrificans TaxID=1482 RepID=A0ABR7VNN0_VIRHA|nr:DUF421 domain-containing protein [Virgibacillus halodenitrificans]MBD1223524.1 DUF421 domain-containing protein [Virgibacillus halodenitrificans]
MEFDWIWKAILIVVGGTTLLRIAGRKSISQMTLAQTVIMIGIGSLLIQPVAGKNIWVTLGVGGILVLTLILMESLQIKGDFFENLISGKSKVVIENGKLNEKNLKKMRLTIDQLETNLRQHNVTNIEDVQWATLEPNGQVGFTLKPSAQPATKQDLLKLKEDLQLKLDQIAFQNNNQFIQNLQQNSLVNKESDNNLFAEVKQQEHTQPPPEHLQ